LGGGNRCAFGLTAAMMIALIVIGTALEELKGKGMQCNALPAAEK
jgi:hypothetical protein